MEPMVFIKRLIIRPCFAVINRLCVATLPSEYNRQPGEFLTLICPQRNLLDSPVVWAESRIEMISLLHRRFA